MKVWGQSVIIEEFVKYLRGYLEIKTEMGRGLFLELWITGNPKQPIGGCYMAITYLKVFFFLNGPRGQSMVAISLSPLGARVLPSLSHSLSFPAVHVPLPFVVSSSSLRWSSTHVARGGRPAVEERQPRVSAGDQ